MMSSWRSRPVPYGCARKSSTRTSENGPSVSVPPERADRSRERRLRDSPLPAGRPQRVLQETGDGHRSDPAWNRRDRACDPGAIFEIAVAHQHGLAAALNAVDADIDDAGTRLDPAALDHFRPSNGRNDEIRPAANTGQVIRSGMRDRDRTIFRQQQLRHRLADNIGTPDHHGFAARELAQRLPCQHHAAERRAWHEAVLSGRKTSRVDDVKSIDVLGGV